MEDLFAQRTVARLPQYLDDILFPCTRRQILEHAEDNEAPDALLDAIENLPNRRYASISEVISYLTCSCWPGKTSSASESDRL